MMRGDVYSAHMDKLRSAVGTQIVYKGRSIAVSRKKLTKRDYELLMESNRNAAFSGLEQFTGSGWDCAGGPMEGESFTWLGTPYTVISRTPETFAGTTCGIALMAYLMPVDSPTGSDDPQAGTWQAAQQD